MSKDIVVAVAVSTTICFSW